MVTILCVYHIIWCLHRCGRLFHSEGGCFFVTPLLSVGPTMTTHKGENTRRHRWSSTAFFLVCIIVCEFDHHHDDHLSNSPSSPQREMTFGGETRIWVHRNGLSLSSCISCLPVHLLVPLIWRRKGKRREGIIWFPSPKESSKDRSLLLFLYPSIYLTLVLSLDFSWLPLMSFVCSLDSKRRILCVYLFSSPLRRWTHNTREKSIIIVMSL